MELYHLILGTHCLCYFLGKISLASTRGTVEDDIVVCLEQIDVLVILFVVHIYWLCIFLILLGESGLLVVCAFIICCKGIG